MKAKIKGTRENAKDLYLNNEYMGKVDNDHDIIRINCTEQEFNNKFNQQVSDIVEAVNGFYEECPAVDYRVEFEEEAEDYE
jgi:hypothetical protein